MNNKIITGLVAILAGGITFRAIQTVRYVKKQKELYEEIQEVSTDEK